MRKVNFATAVSTFQSHKFLSDDAIVVAWGALQHFVEMDDLQRRELLGCDVIKLRIVFFGI